MLILIPLSDWMIYMMKSIHVCFSPKTGMSDKTLFPEVTVALYQNISYTDIYHITCVYNVCV